MSARNRRTIRRHIGLRPTRSGSGRRHRTAKDETQGAFGRFMSEEIASLEEAEAVNEHREIDRRGDGAAYERFGEIVRELNESMHEMRERTVYFPATPFMIVLLKELVEELHGIFDGAGNELAEDLSSLADVSSLNELSGITVDDLLQKIIDAMPRVDQEILGLVPISSLERAKLEDMTRAHTIQRAAERLGINLSQTNYNDLVKICREGKPVAINHMRELHWASINDKPALVIFHRRTGRIHTLMDEAMGRRVVEFNLARSGQAAP